MTLTDKLDVTQLGGVPETLLITLYARKLESERENGLFYDPKAVEMVSRIDYDFTRFDGLSAMPSLALRVKAIDDIVCTFLEEQANAIVVQLGAGLDSRFDRLDNGFVRWYELDLPQTIALRDILFEPAERRQHITSSVLDFTWVDQIPAGSPVLFVAEGLLYYLEEAQVKNLLQVLTDRFPDSEIVFDTVPRLMARFSHRMKAPARTSVVQDKEGNEGARSPWLWGIHHGEEFELWSSDIRLVKEGQYMQTYHPDFPASARVIGRIPVINRLTSPLIIHLAW